MKYEVIRDFVDVQSDNHLYRVGESFPYDGANVSEDRCVELASEKNRCGIALIKPIEVEEKDVVEKPKKSSKKKEK